ncbi:MAG: EAL domain-containing protein [Gammaproteobacteria bacterium]
MSNLSIMQSLLNDREISKADLGALTFPAGSRVFAQGEAADCAYMIDRGYVEVSAEINGERCGLAVLGPGEIVGEIAVLDGLPRSATATALHDTSLILIPRRQLLDEIDAAGPLARLVLMSANSRLRAAQTFLSKEDVPDVVDELLSTGYESSRADAARHMRQSLALREAIEQHQFALAFQPIASMTDGRTAGFEALIRWPQGDKAAISPVDFIPLAESNGQILPLGKWVLEQSIEALYHIDRVVGRRSRRGAKPFVSVNVSPRQLESQAHVERLAAIIESADVSAQRIKLEITEQALLRDPETAALSLARLKASGAMLAIDDFGTGYSSLSYLQRFPFDILKVDRSFVSRLSDDPGARRIVAAIIALARELGLDVVAEGVETRDEVAWLQSHGCHFAQGYLLARPGPLAGVLPCLDRPMEW